MIQPIARTRASTSRDVPGRKKQMMPAMTVSAPRIPATARHHPGEILQRHRCHDADQPGGDELQPEDQGHHQQGCLRPDQGDRPKDDADHAEGDAQSLGFAVVVRVESDMS